MSVKESSRRDRLGQLILSRLSREEVKDFFKDHTQPYRDLMAYSRCAMMEIETKFNVLNEEFSLMFDRQPINSVKSRLKNPRLKSLPPRNPLRKSPLPKSLLQSLKAS